MVSHPPPSSAADQKLSTTAGVPRRIVILTAPMVEELDVVGPVSVFSRTNVFRPGSYRIEIVTTAREQLVTGMAGVPLLARGRYSELKGAVDTLLVAGGDGMVALRDPQVFSWTRKMAKRVRRLGSICTGSFMLAEAGLLDGKKATTHWSRAAELAVRYPKVDVLPDPIWVQDGSTYTSAGVTAGMDLALALVQEDYGNAVALAVARNLVLFLRRPGNQAQFSVTLAAQASEKKPLLELQVWIAENLRRDLSVETLAGRAAMSQRNFCRVFARELGTTPASYVEHARREAARRFLEQTPKSVEEVASLCGFSSAELMRRSFLRSLGITPSQYRLHFNARNLPA